MKKSEFEGWGGLVGALLLLGGALFPFYQFILWLKEGFWTPMSLDRMLAWIGVGALTYVIGMHWEGAKIVCMWIITLPLSVGLIALALAQFYLLQGIADKVCDERKEIPRQLPD